MCTGGGGGGGPSSSQIKAERQRQRKFNQKQNKLVRDSQKQAADQHDENLANSKDQFEKSRKDSLDQFNASMAFQAEQSALQMATQEAQFAAAQAAQEAALQQQLLQNEEMARRSEESANRAMGMKLVGQDPDAVKLKSSSRKKARKKAVTGTSQLANPLTISFGGGS